MQVPEVVAQETNELLQQCLPVFSARDDVTAVREVGRDITDMHNAGEGRHLEILSAIKGEYTTPHASRAQALIPTPSTPQNSRAKYSAPSRSRPNAR